MASSTAAIIVQGVALPPGPSQPPVAQTINWIVRPGPFMESCLRRYGRLFTVRLAQIGTFVFVAEPAAIKQIFTGDPEELRAGEANEPLEPVLGGRSILLLDGAEHLRQRKLMLPPFHGERLARYGELMAAIADRDLDGWPIGRRFRLQPRLQAITLEVILRVVFGVEDPGRLARLRTLLTGLMNATAKPVAMAPWLRRDLGPWSPWARFMRMLDEVDRALYEEIAARRADPGLAEREDIFSMLVQARDEDGGAMSDRELRDELMTLLVAGHETTATGLAWTFELLFRHPAALERAGAEAREGAGHEYADAVVKETLRLRAPIPLVARRLTVPMRLDGHELPAGTRLAPCIYLTHRLADVYPDPEAFRPERFLDQPADTYSWLPFGGGIRRCLGASFATYEMRVVLQTVLARARLRAASRRPARVTRRAIVLAPSRGVEAVLDERRLERSKALDALALERR
jgi:cytochrome P450